MRNIFKFLIDCVAEAVTDIIILIMYVVAWLALWLVFMAFSPFMAAIYLSEHLVLDVKNRRNHTSNNRYRHK